MFATKAGYMEEYNYDLAEWSDIATKLLFFQCHDEEDNVKIIYYINKTDFISAFPIFNFFMT